MAGATIRHELVVANAIRAVGNRLVGKPCQVYGSNLRIRIPRTVLYTYPDASVICGRAEMDSDDSAGETVTNPRVIVEVLSGSTETYDRGEKFDRYRLLDSLQEYVLISQDLARIDTYFRQEGGTWLFAPAVDVSAVARLRSLEIDLPLAEVYAGVALPPATEVP